MLEMSKPPPKPTAQAAKEQRLADALKRNIGRRKAAKKDEKAGKQ
jgi:hypothetical protein